MVGPQQRKMFPWSKPANVESDGKGRGTEDEMLS